jgi:hypothetical protein
MERLSGSQEEFSFMALIFKQNELHRKYFDFAAYAVFYDVKFTMIS